MARKVNDIPKLLICQNTEFRRRVIRGLKKNLDPGTWIGQKD